MAPAPTLLLVLLTLLVAPAAATQELMSEVVRLRALVARQDATITTLHATLKVERAERALLRRVLAPGRDMFSAGEGLKSFCTCKQAREGLCVLPKGVACSATAAAVDPASTLPSENPSAGPTSLQPSMLLEVSHSAARSALRAAAAATSSSSAASSSASSSSAATSTSTRDMFAAGEGLKAFCSCKQAHLGLCVLDKDTPCPAVDLSHSNGGVSTVPGSNPSAGPTTLMPPTMLLETATEMATATAGRRVRRRAGRAKGEEKRKLADKRRRSREAVPAGAGRRRGGLPEDKKRQKGKGEEDLFEALPEDKKRQKGKGEEDLFEAVEAKNPEIKGGNGVALPPSSKPASAAAAGADAAAAVNVAVADAAAGSGGGFGDDSPVFKKWPKESVQCRQCCDLRCMEDCLETRFR